jgi:hypothetical protein
MRSCSGRCHRPQPRRGQLEGEGKPVEPAGDLSHRDQVELVADSRGPGPVNEERQGRRRRGGKSDGTQIAVGRRERVNVVGVLARHAEPFPARRQYRRLWTPLEHGVQQLGRRVHDMLARVEDDQRLPCCQRVDQSIKPAGTGTRAHTEGFGDSVGDRVRLLDPSELDQPHAVLEVAGDGDGRLQGKPRFSHAARPSQRH